MNIDMNTFKKLWIKYVSLWNKGVIYIVLVIIWFLILTPTALIRKIFQRLFFLKQKEQNSFLKKSTQLSLSHFTKPF